MLSLANTFFETIVKLLHTVKKKKKDDKMIVFTIDTIIKNIFKKSTLNILLQFSAVLSTNIIFHNASFDIAKKYTESLIK